MKNFTHFYPIGLNLSNFFHIFIWCVTKQENLLYNLFCKLKVAPVMVGSGMFRCSVRAALDGPHQTCNAQCSFCIPVSIFNGKCANG